MYFEGLMMIQVLYLGFKRKKYLEYIHVKHDATYMGGMLEN